MAKIITINYEGKEYTLEYTKKSIEVMETAGFEIQNIRSKPMTSFPLLFAGAFLAHHKGLPQKEIDKIVSKLPNKEEFLDRLAEMYNEQVNELFDEPSEAEGNATWGANW